MMLSNGSYPNITQNAELIQILTELYENNENVEDDVEVEEVQDSPRAEISKKVPKATPRVTDSLDEKEGTGINKSEKGPSKPRGLWEAVSSSHAIDPVYIALDLETTGTAASLCRVIEIGARVLGAEHPPYQKYVKLPPFQKIPNEVVSLTSITDEMLDTHGVSFPEMWDGFLSWLSHIQTTVSGRPMIIIAHNGKVFDFTVIDNELRRHSSPSAWTYDANIVAFVDTLKVVRDAALWSPDQLPQHQRLGYIYQVLFGEEIPSSHTALGDVDALIRILNCDRIYSRWKSIAAKYLFNYRLETHLP